MRTVSADDLDPTLRIANWFDCSSVNNWGPRTIEDPELLLVHAGRFNYRVIGEPWQTVSERDVLFIPPGVLHELTVDPRAARSGLSCWHGELVQQGTWAAGNYRPAVMPPTITPVSGHPFIIACFRRLADVYIGYGTRRVTLAHDLVRLIWIHLMDIWTAEQGPAPSRRLDPMLAWVRERLHLQIGRNQLAQAFDLTPQHVNALFKHGLGTTPGGFVRRERILRAWHDLHTGGMSVNEAATRWGFSDPFHFSRVFRREMGFPPSQAR
ncbi:MAG: AraC family transcriptional regulator [Planctomycetota bacterium]